MAPQFLRTPLLRATYGHRESRLSASSFGREIRDHNLCQYAKLQIFLITSSLLRWPFAAPWWPCTPCPIPAIPLS